jgi:hypothetical protein
MPLPVAAIMAILGGVQAATGIGQKIGAGIQRRKAEKEFDKYEVPSGIESMIDVMQGLASQTEVPGADILRSRQRATTAEGVEAASRTSESSGDVLGSLHQLYGKQMESEERLALAGAQQYQMNQMRYANALQTLGQYQTQKWQYNELYPYMQRMTYAGQLSGAGSENIRQGIGTGLNAFMLNNDMFNGQQPASPMSTSPTFGRTPEQESALRNLPTPSTGLNIDRTPPRQWVPEQYRGLTEPEPNWYGGTFQPTRSY